MTRRGPCGVERSERGAPGERGARGERGETLIELVMAVAIMGVSFTGILTGIATTATTSGVHRQQAATEAVLRASAEGVKEAAYVPCARPADYTDAMAPAQGVELSVAGVQYWNAATSAFASSPATCPGSDGGVQLVSLQATNADGRVTMTSDVVKREP